MNKLISIFILSTLLLTACESEQRLITRSVDLPTKDKKSTLPYPSKPAAAIGMSYTMEKNVEAGKPIEINIQLTNKVSVDDLLVSFKLDSGLTADSVLTQNFGVLPAGAESTINMRVIAANNGIYYINITATLVTDKQQGRSFVIPVNVGNVDAKQSMKVNGNIETDSSGRKIIIMPAEMVH